MQTGRTNYNLRQKVRPGYSDRDFGFTDKISDKLSSRRMGELSCSRKERSKMAGGREELFKKKDG